MSASGPLSAAVSAVGQAASNLSSAVDAYVAAGNASTANMTPDADVQAAVTALLNVATTLQTEVAKLAPKA